MAHHVWKDNISIIQIRNTFQISCAKNTSLESYLVFPVFSCKKTLTVIAYGIRIGFQVSETYYLCILVL